jgi:hypothetical protein
MGYNYGVREKLICVYSTNQLSDVKLEIIIVGGASVIKGGFLNPYKTVNVVD